MDKLMSLEAGLRLGSFLGLFLLIALWETLAPRRQGSYPRRRRWPSNIGIAALNTLLLRVLMPTAAVGIALLASERGWGLLNQLSLSPALAVALSVLALDLLIYTQHLVFHHVPVLWRLHRLHHSDPDFDVTTGVRFHPLEILLSMVIKMAAVALLGAPAVGVLLFELLLNATAVFNHGNIRLPTALDRVLRWIVVTPDMHRVHHSVVKAETNSNFGFSIPWWDRIFGTYRAQPAAGHAGMHIGLSEFSSARELTLGQMLIQPWQKTEANPSSGSAESQ